MGMQTLLDALGDGSAVRVRTKSGKLYDVERHVLTTRAREARPFIYGWPVVPKWHRSHGRVRWFYADSVEPAETGDQVNV